MRSGQCAHLSRSQSIHNTDIARLSGVVESQEIGGSTGARLVEPALGLSTSYVEAANPALESTTTPFSRTPTSSHTPMPRRSVILLRLRKSNGTPHADRPDGDRPTLILPRKSLPPLHLTNRYGRPDTERDFSPVRSNSVYGKVSPNRRAGQALDKPSVVECTRFVKSRHAASPLLRSMPFTELASHPIFSRQPRTWKNHRTRRKWAFVASCPPQPAPPSRRSRCLRWEKPSQSLVPEAVSITGQAEPSWSSIAVGRQEVALKH